MKYIFRELEKLEFAEFALKHSQSNFFQTTNMGDKFVNDGFEVYYVGLEENKKIVAASMIMSNQQLILGKKTFESYKGFLIDYHNQELIEKFTHKIKTFIKKKNGFRILIDPYIPSVSRNSDGKLISGIDNRSLVETLKKNGYKKIKDNAQVKWIYCLDVENKTIDELYDEMKANTKNCINKTINKYKLVYRKLDYDELAIFKNITQHTCDKKNFLDRPLKYYQKMYNYFKDNICFVIAELDCDLCIDNLQQENRENNKKIDALSNSKSNRNKKEQLKKINSSNNEKIEEIKLLKQSNGNSIPLSSAMFITYGKEVVYLFSGSYEEYMSFYGQYRIQWEMIQFACEKGYKRYNFYGISDNFSKGSKDYGIYEFKKGFGGYVEELIGPFEIGVSKHYKIYNYLRKLKNILKK